MDTQVLLALCLTIVIVVVVNAALLWIVRRQFRAEDIEMFRRAGGRAQNPWGPENEELQTLSRLVSDLQPADDDDQTPDGLEEGT